MEKLTKGQKEALEAVRTGRNVCITGGGGVGKSYISRKSSKICRNKDQVESFIKAIGG